MSVKAVDFRKSSGIDKIQGMSHSNFYRFKR